MNSRCLSSQLTGLIAVCVSLMGLAGCLTPCPFHDPLADQPPVTTPSVEGVREAAPESHFPERRGKQKVVLAKSGTVLHRPLYFEDGFEECGSYNEEFAWTGEDVGYVFVGPIWFLANAVTVPVEAVIDPPWAVMASDGVPHCRRPWLCSDAQRWCCRGNHDGPPYAAVVNKDVDAVE